jgi:hypothetical protein
MKTDVAHRVGRFVSDLNEYWRAKERAKRKIEVIRAIKLAALALAILTVAVVLRLNTAFNAIIAIYALTVIAFVAQARKDHPQDWREAARTALFQIAIVTIGMIVMMWRLAS